MRPTPLGSTLVIFGASAAAQEGAGAPEVDEAALQERGSASSARARATA